MSTLLQLNTSIFEHDGQSTRLAQGFVDAWLARNPQTRLLVRDLGRDPVPHLNAERFRALLTSKEQRTAAQQSVVNYSDRLIDELRQASVIVLGLPMYNFGVPSSLKAYFDHIARVGVTFRYTAQGPVGLMEDKPVFVLAARGGNYVGTAKDSQSRYVMDFLNFIGLTSVRFVYAEGLNIDEDTRQRAMDQALGNIQTLVA